MRQMLQCPAQPRQLKSRYRVTPKHAFGNEIVATPSQQSRPTPGVVHGHGKADGFPDGFRFAERASGPPSGSTGNALAGRSMSSLLLCHAGREISI